MLCIFPSAVTGAEKLSQNEIDEIIKNLENGDADTQLRAGLMYATGQYVKRNDENALYWFEKSYKQGNIEAKFLYALALSFVHPRQKREVFDLAKQIAETDPNTIKKVYGFSEHGHTLYSTPEEMTAAAKFLVGRMYNDEEFVMKDYKQSESWLNKSLEYASKDLKELINRELNELRNKQPKKSQPSKSQTPAPKNNNTVSLSEPKDFNEAKGNASKFLMSIYDVAEKLSSTEPYTAQDIEFMAGDNVYMRLWYNEKYFMFCFYPDMSWSKKNAKIARFRVYSPEFVFAGGIKIGSAFKNIKDLFGDFSDWNARNSILSISEGLDDADIHVTNGKIDYIEYIHRNPETGDFYSFTHKMRNIFQLYRDNIETAFVNVASNSKLNVREAPGTHGNILFTVTNQDNILLIDKDGRYGEGWCRVRFVLDKNTGDTQQINRIKNPA